MDNAIEEIEKEVIKIKKRFSCAKCEKACVFRSQLSHTSTCIALTLVLEAIKKARF